MSGARWVKLGLFLLVVVGVAWGGLTALGLRVTDITPDNVRGFVLSFGVLAPVIYLAAYGQPIVPLPASVMTITGGLAFGPIWGTLAALTGATIRACSQFFVARLLGRAAVEKLLKGGVADLNQRLGDNSFKAVLLIRIIPNFPFDVQNYGLGFSRVRFAPYFLGTVLGMPLSAFVFANFGYALTDPRNTWKLLLAVLLIIGLILAQRRLTRRASPGPPGTP
ncbi:MAG: TVP38/TMEM64 family protein [Candidatus Omnitrophica bacterium]|nr:TVP38/TMEM64 family protein [Candidatus Omnitrophota bacterium]MBI3021132.1 TVP38/TMEM64 family protein [Candidatus Omnitrophota bacterium]MBI3083615.1 TVP38/TMEM64 family protein [Candidatus Omnitrophota bacterium]